MPDPASHFIRDDGVFPGNDLVPLVLYAGALQGADAGIIETLFARHAWPPAWRYTVYDFHHYHSTAHEALGCFQGAARIQFGGPTGPVLDFKAGDAIWIPAGVAHCRLDSRGGFTVVGAYPVGTGPDMNYGKPGERPGVDANIAAVALPLMGPMGDEPLVQAGGFTIH
jgi:uncharacterized protein YjlB